MQSATCRSMAALAGAVAVLFAGAAGAQPAGDTPPSPGAGSNLYIGLAYGHATARKACEGLAGCDDRDNTFGAFAGYRLGQRFAVEGGYHNLGKATATGGTYVRSNVWELVGVGGWPLGSTPLSLYGKLGLARGAQEGGGALNAPKERTISVTYGFGAQVDLPRRFGVRAEWQRYPRLGGGPVLAAGDIDVVRLAALWRFR